MGLFRRSTAKTRKQASASKSSGKKAVSRTKKPVPVKRHKSKGFRIFFWLVTLCFWAVAITGLVVAYVFFTLDQKGLFAVPEREPGILLLAADGSRLAERGSFFGDAVRIDQVPDYLPNAIIAIEDRRFRSHFGIDPIGLTRAMVSNFKAGRVVEGGSTLTQQLAKNLFLTSERSFERKFYEAVLALWLENKYSKDEILQLYLNRVYFGGGAIGVDKAARKFFNKSASEVSLKEAAILAGLLKAPTTYNPVKHPKKAEKRSQLVLNAMVRTGAVTAEEAKHAVNIKPKIQTSTYISSNHYIVDWIESQLTDLIGKLDQSIIVKTTIDPKLQRIAERAIADRLAKDGKGKHVSQGAAVVLDTTGAVKAMVGGRSYRSSQYNRATRAKRQPGSAFKPFVYLTAIENGFSPSSVEIDQPIRVGDWTPGNYSNKYAGPVTLTTALAKSINTVAVQLAVKVGPKSIIGTARRLGISSDMKNNASIALGTSEVTLLELTNAYVPFANNGFAVLPHGVTKITSRDGQLIYERQGSGLGKAIYDYDLGDINYMMQKVVDEGTAKKARIKGRDIAGKTGTTQDYRDAWFIGYSAQMVAGIWVGNDDNSPTKKVTGGSIPTLIWHDIMTAALANYPNAPLPGQQRPEHVTPPPLSDDPVFGQILQQDQPPPPPPTKKTGISGFLNNIFGIGGSSTPSPQPQRSQNRRGGKAGDDGW